MQTSQRNETNRFGKLREPDWELSRTGEGWITTLEKPLAAMANRSAMAANREIQVRAPHFKGAPETH